MPAFDAVVERLANDEPSAMTLVPLRPSNTRVVAALLDTFDLTCCGGNYWNFDSMIVVVDCDEREFSVKAKHKQ